MNDILITTIYSAKVYKSGKKIKLRGLKYTVVDQDSIPVIVGLVEPKDFLYKTNIKRVV